MSEQHDQNAAGGNAVSFRGKMSIPFDLDAIFTMQYDVSGLKKCLEFIFENMGEMNDHIKASNDKANDALNKANAHDDLIKNLEQMCKELEEKSAHHDQQIADVIASTESNTLNISLNQKNMQEGFEDVNDRLKKHDLQIEDLRRQLGATSQLSIPPVTADAKPASHSDSAAGLELGELDKRYAQRPAVDTAIGRIKNLEATLAEMADKVQQNTNGVNEHEDSLRAVLKRLDGHDTTLGEHRHDIDTLKRQVEALSSVDTDAGNIDATALLRKIHFLEQKLEDKADRVEVTQARAYTDDQVSMARKDLEKTLDSLRAEVSNFREAWELFHSRDWKDLCARVEALEKRMQAVNKTLEGFNGAPEYQGGGGKISDEMVIQITNRLSSLEVNYTDLRDQFSKWIKQIQDELNLKADRADLEELEKTLMNRLNDIITALTKQFADKAETKKALKLLERQLKNLYDLFMSKGGYNNEDEAMFSKKPLGGFSCASCEKDLVNLHGKKVEFMPWSKLPFRDPAERIARVGQGFSKMLSMINPDQLSGFQHTSKLQDVYTSQNQGGMAQTASNFHPQGADDEGTRFPPANGRGGSNVGPRNMDQSPEYKRPGSAGARQKIPRISQGRSHKK